MTTTNIDINSVLAFDDMESDNFRFYTLPAAHLIIVLALNLMEKHKDAWSKIRNPQRRVDKLLKSFDCHYSEFLIHTACKYARNVYEKHNFTNNSKT